MILLDRNCYTGRASGSMHILILPRARLVRHKASANPSKRRFVDESAASFGGNWHRDFPPHFLADPPPAETPIRFCPGPDLNWHRDFPPHFLADPPPAETPIRFCPGPDLNWHRDLTPRRILSPLRLPIPPPGQNENIHK